MKDQDGNPVVSELKPFRSFKRAEDIRVVNIGNNKIEIPPQTHAYEYNLRPDIKESYVADLVEQLLLPYGGLSRETSTAGGLKMEIVNDPPDHCWSRLAMYIGVNLQFQRVLFLLIAPSLEQTSFVKKLSQYINTNSEYDVFCDDVANRLLSAFESDEVIFHLTTPLSSFLEDDSSFETSICYVHNNSGNSGMMCEGIVDTVYIGNLQTTFAQLMNMKLQYEVDAVDQSMKSVELKCAKMMTLLKPTYQRSNLQLPNPPQSKSLSQYPLTLKRDSIRDVSLDTCRLFLLRARKSYRDYCTTENTVNELSSDKQYNHQLSFIVINLIKQFKDWVEEEYKIRIKRKIDSVKDRLEALQHFKIQLVLVLHDRFNINNISNGGIISGLSNSIWSLSAFNQDRNFQLSLQEKFPFIDFNEPVIHDSQCIMHQKTGSLFITAGHLLFYSITTLMTNPHLVVVPMRTIVQLQLYGGGKANYTSSYNHGESNDSILRNHSLGLSMTNGDSIKLTDSSQQEIMIRFTDNTPEYAARVFDLMDLLLKERLFLLCEYRPQNDKDVMSMNTQKVFDSIVNIDDVLEVITFSTSDSSTPTYTTDSPIPTQDKKPSQATASASPEVDLLDLSDFSVSIPMVSSPVPPISLKPVDSASTQISEEAPKGQPKKKLGANIQKFLQQTQSKANNIG